MEDWVRGKSLESWKFENGGESCKNHEKKKKGKKSQTFDTEKGKHLLDFAIH